MSIKEESDEKHEEKANQEQSEDSRDVVKSFYIGKNSVLSGRARIITVVMDKLTLQATEEIFSNGSVLRGALTKHTLADMKLHHTLA